MNPTDDQVEIAVHDLSAEYIATPEAPITGDEARMARAMVPGEELTPAIIEALVWRERYGEWMARRAATAGLELAAIREQVSQEASGIGETLAAWRVFLAQLVTALDLPPEAKPSEVLAAVKALRAHHDAMMKADTEE